MKTLLKLGLIAAVLPFAAAAEEGGTAACRADAQKYCSSAGNKMECLIDHQNDITDGCYSFLKTALQRQKGIQACKADAQKFCANAEKGNGGIKSCLIDHQKEISDECYSTLKSMQDKSGSSSQGAEPSSTTSAAPASNPIYKVKTADGRTVYTNAPLAGSQELTVNRVNDAVPVR